jgi:hypothetical protein
MATVLSKREMRIAWQTARLAIYGMGGWGPDSEAAMRELIGLVGENDAALLARMAGISEETLAANLEWCGYSTEKAVALATEVRLGNRLEEVNAARIA